MAFLLQPLILFSISCLYACNALEFELLPNVVKCIKEEFRQDTLVSGSASISPSTDLQLNMKITTSDLSVVFENRDLSQSSNYAFTSQHESEYAFCFFRHSTAEHRGRPCATKIGEFANSNWRWPKGLHRPRKEGKLETFGTGAKEIGGPSGRSEGGFCLHEVPRRPAPRHQRINKLTCCLDDCNKFGDSCVPWGWSNLLFEAFLPFEKVDIDQQTFHKHRIDVFL